MLCAPSLTVAGALLLLLPLASMASGSEISGEDLVCYKTLDECSAECSASACYRFDECNGDEGPHGDGMYACIPDVRMIVIGLLLFIALLSIGCCLCCCLCPACILAKCIEHRRVRRGTVLSQSAPAVAAVDVPPEAAYPPPPPYTDVVKETVS